MFTATDARWTLATIQRGCLQLVHTRKGHSVHARDLTAPVVCVGKRRGAVKWLFKGIWAFLRLVLRGAGELLEGY